MKGREPYTDAEKDYIQRWKYYGVYLCFFPLVFSHILEYLITGNFSFEPFLVDFLLLGFSLAVAVFGMVADVFAEKKGEIRFRAIITVLCGFSFFIFHIIFMQVKSIGEVSIISRVVLFLAVALFAVYEYNTGKIIRLWQASDAMDLESFKSVGNLPKAHELAEEKNE